MIADLILLLAAALMIAAAVLTLIRITRGPGTLDRVVATDVLISVLMLTVALRTVQTGDTSYLPVILALALIGFAGSLSVARFVSDRDKAVKWGPSSKGLDGTRPPKAGGR